MARFPGGNGELAPQPPHIMGPTWARNTDGSWHLPENTLGWGVINWWGKYVKSPGGDHAGEAFMPTLEQARFTLWWYAVDDEGNYTFREGLFRRLKGHGKDPFAAALSLAELCGPVAFSHFDESGNPVGKARHAAWVTVAAVSQDQTKNTFSLFPTMISKELKSDYGLDVNRFIIYSEAGGRLEAATTSPGSMEGNRPTFVVENEALALDTPIPTPDGWVSMGDIQTGDIIFGSDGAPVEVTKALPVQHGRDCYEVVFSDGTSIVASDGHLWQTSVVGSAAKPKIRTTQEMFEDGRKFAVPRSGARKTSDVDLPVDPYLLGVWLGDGSTGDCNIAVGDKDVEELEKQLADRGITTHLMKSAEGKAKRLSFSNQSGFQGANRPGPAVEMRKLECFQSKHIPQEYMQAGLNQREELLRGLMDTDGCASDRGQCIFIGRKRLSEDVVELLRSLGQLPSISFVEDSRSREGGYYRVTFTPWRIQPFALKRKADRVRGSKRDWTSIKEIRPVDSVPVRCIAVEAEDRLFQAGVSGHTTHNTQWWGTGPDGAANEGVEMDKIIEGNVAKIPSARKLAICNAHIPGNDTVAEKVYDTWCDIESGKAVDTGLLYDAIEAPADTPVSEIPSEKEDPDGYEKGIEMLREGLVIARGDSTWLPVDEIMMSVLDVKNDIIESRRKFLNQVNAAEDAWISFSEWDPLALTDPLFALKKGEKVTLGFDGSKSNDWSALVACRVSDGMLFLLNVWDPERYGGEIPREDVDAAVRSAFDRYEVVSFRADVKEFEAYVDQWGHDFKRKVKVKASPNNPVAFDMRGQKKKFALDCERFLDAVLERELNHDGNKVLRQHILNARRHPTIYDAISIRKASKDSGKKIDAAVCSVLAFGARHEYLMSKRARTGRAVILR